MKNSVKKIYLASLILIIVFIIVAFIVYIVNMINDTIDYVSGDYKTKVTFYKARFLGKFKSGSSGEWYDSFELEDGTNLKLAFSRDGHTGEPNVLIAQTDFISKNNRVVKSSYEVSTDLNKFLGRIGIMSDKFYIFNIEQGLNLETDILSGYTYMNDMYQKNGMQVWVYFNNEDKDENAISEFLLSEDESLIKDKYTYHKIDSYQTEIGTLYILGKENQEADIKYTMYVGALKYKEGNNQELIFELGYLHDNTNDITSIFKDIVKEVKIKNNVEE